MFKIGVVESATVGRLAFNGLMVHGVTIWQFTLKTTHTHIRFALHMGMEVVCKIDGG